MFLPISVRETKLSTNYTGVLKIKGIVTDCTPDALMEYLYSTFLVILSTDQSQTAIL